MDAETVAFILSQILAEYEVTISPLLWVRPANKQTLELMKTTYLEYGGTKFKNMEQPREADKNVTLYTNGG